MKNNLVKGLTYIAIGFLFTLANFNLKFGDVTINIMPDFIGWILFYLAFNELGDYITGKEYMKWVAIGLAVVSGVFWILSIAKPDMNIDVIQIIFNIVSAIFQFILFGILYNIALDYQSSYANRINILRFLNICLYVFISFVALFFGNDPANPLLWFAAGLTLVLLVIAIYTCFVLFQFKNDIAQKNG